MYSFINAENLLQGMTGETEFVAFDVETTGLYPEMDRITEIGAVRLTLTHEKATFCELVDPGQPIQPDASRVSGITDEMVRGKPTIEDILAPFIAFVSSAPLVAHNAPFDAAFLFNALKRSNWPLLPNPILDTRLLAKALWPSWGRYSLAQVLESIGITKPRGHRALEDARSCGQVFVACVRKILEQAEVTGQVKMRTVFRLAEDDVDQPV
jgi:DNA polymerase III epsilon subunit family exonuclease